MQTLQFSFEAIGTSWTIDIFAYNSRLTKQDFINKVHERIEVYDKVYSRFRPDSTLVKLAAKGGQDILPNDSRELFKLYHKLYKITDKAFTPLIGNVMEDLGYDASYSLKPKETIRQAPKWEDIIEFHYPKLELKQPAMLDFGAGGKGHIVDQVGVLLELEGVTSYCIDAGGDILYKSAEQNPLRIGLEHPANPKQVIGLVNITNGSICGSAGNRRKWDKYHHIVDPKTNTSPEHIVSVWVIAKKAILADALATALYFTSPEVLSEHFTFDYAMLYKDLTLKKSETFPGEIFYNT